MDAPRLVVFDFDGTLADSMPFFLANLDAVASTHGFRSFGKDDLDQLRGMGTRELLAYAGIAWWKLPRVSQDFRRRMAASSDSITLFDGVPTMLATLAARVPVAIVTSNSRENVEAVLGDAMRHVSFGQYAAAFLGKTGRLRRVCREAGVPAGQAVYLGDEQRDVEAARASGMRAGAVSWGYASHAALQSMQPDYLFTEVAEVTQVLLPPA